MVGIGLLGEFIHPIKVMIPSSTKVVTLANVDACKFFIGRWNELYACVLALNSLVFATGQMHYSFKNSIIWQRSRFVFHDCSGNRYSLIKENITLVTEQRYGESGSKFTSSELLLFSESGGALGLLLIIALFRLKTWQLIAIGAMMYSLCPLLHLTRNKTFARASIFISSVAARMTRIPLMLHSFESLPRHIRIYSLPIMFTTGIIFDMWMILFSRFIEYSIFWMHLMVAVSIVTISSLHIRFAPPDIMHTLLNADSGELYIKLKKWVRKGKIINIDSLIDCVLYRGPVFSSQMRTFANLLTFGPLFRKTAICAILLPVGTIISSSANYYLQERLSYGIYESDFISHLLCVAGMVLSVYLVKRCGRRLTMALMLATAIMSQVLLLNVRLEMYNACRKISSPQGWRATLAHVAYVFAMLSSSVLLIVPRLMLMEHVPTSVRFLVPLAFVVDYVALLLRASLRFLETRIPKAYPNGGIIYALAYTLFVAPFALLLDNSDHLPINIWEIPAYRAPQTRYSTKIVPNDTPSEHFSVRMMLQACAAAEETEMRAQFYNRKTVESL